MKASELVTRLLDVLEASQESTDLPVVIGDSWKGPCEPTHVTVQQVCHNAKLCQCTAPRCEAAFTALVIS